MQLRATFCSPSVTFRKYSKDTLVYFVIRLSLLFSSKRTFLQISWTSSSSHSDWSLNSLQTIWIGTVSMKHITDDGNLDENRSVSICVTISWRRELKPSWCSSVGHITASLLKGFSSFLCHLEVRSIRGWVRWSCENLMFFSHVLPDSILCLQLWIQVKYVYVVRGCFVSSICSTTGARSFTISA